MRCACARATTWIRFSKYKCNRALGVVVAGGDGMANYRGFGKTNSALAFGHGGAGGQIGWADPATGISLGYATNGFDRNDMRQGRRGVALSSLRAPSAPCVGRRKRYAGERVARARSWLRAGADADHRDLSHRPVR